MSEPLFMGIDGGGSKLRVAIVNAKLEALTALEAGPVNPSLIGRIEAAARIQDGLRRALKRTGRAQDCIAAVGAGIAGASNQHSGAWLRVVLQPILPASRLVASSDLEIALVGALARRHGILLLAGTGSAALGVRPDGRRLQVGGWGYLLGDEGSGFWIGSRLLRRVAEREDCGGEPSMTDLCRATLERTGVSGARELIAWVYRSERTPAGQIASLAPLVLERADAGDRPAIAILRGAARHLAELVETLRRRLDYAEAPVAFAGGLLDNDNWLSREVSRRLGLAERPEAKYPPVIGAALLARMEWSMDDA